MKEGIVLKKLFVGDTAPIFNLMNQQNNDINIKSYRGKIIFLYFFLRPLTFRSCQEAFEIKKIKDEFSKMDIVFLGICPDQPKKSIRFFEENELNFDLLSDPDNLIAKKYGVLGSTKLRISENLKIANNAFLVGTNGKIKRIFEDLSNFPIMSV